MQLVTSWMEEGIEQGLTQGRREGSLRLLLRQLNRRFGPLDAELSERFEKLSLGQLEELGEELFNLTSISDVEQWFDRLTLKQRSLKAAITDAFGGIPEQVEKELEGRSPSQLAALESDLPDLSDIQLLQNWLFEHPEAQPD